MFLVKRGPEFRVGTVQIFVIPNTLLTHKYFQERLAPPSDAKLLETLKCHSGINPGVICVLIRFLSPGKITITSMRQPQPRHTETLLCAVPSSKIQPAAGENPS